MTDEPPSRARRRLLTRAFALGLADDVRTAIDRSWIAGFATALAEIHRQLLNGNNSSGVCDSARNAGITIATARAAGVSNYDLRELRKAGMR